MMDVDSSRWSGEGTFTQTLVETLKTLAHLAFIRVEDAPASRSDADYNFISNEIYVGFQVVVRVQQVRRLGIWPGSRRVPEPAMTMAELEKVLGGLEAIGPSDYADEGMIQYLRTERVIPPYQTRGYKLVELVRIYEAPARPRPRT